VHHQRGLTQEKNGNHRGLAKVEGGLHRGPVQEEIEEEAEGVTLVVEKMGSPQDP